MSRSPQTFRQSDLERAIRAVTKAGATTYEVVIEGPRVIVRVPKLSTGPDTTVADDSEVIL
jgi:hypothetical protein